MIDLLRDVLPYLEQLPPEAQEEVAAYIEALAEVFARSHVRRIPHEVQPTERWEDPMGAWSDLPDTMLEELDQLRHTYSPIPSLEYLSDDRW